MYTVIEKTNNHEEEITTLPIANIPRIGDELIIGDIVNQNKKTYIVTKIRRHITRAYNEENIYEIIDVLVERIE